MDRLRPSKGIKLIKGCYPKKNENVDSQHLSHQLDALLKYLLYSPKTVPEICKYIEKRMRKDLAKQRFGNVLISVEVFNSIIVQCHNTSNNMYGPYVVSILQEMFSHSKQAKQVSPSVLQEIYTMKLKGVETFEKFATRARYNKLTEYQDLGFFVEYFVDMANSNAQDIEIKRKMRIWGLRGLHTYITSVEDLDTFVAKYVDINNTTMQNKPQVLPTILTNMVEFKEDVRSSSIERDINTDNNPNATSSSATASSSTTTTQKEHIETPYTLASMCLSDLSRSQSATTVRSLLVAVLNFLNTYRIWLQPNNIANDFIKAISSKNHYSTIITQLLSTVESPNISPVIKLHVVNCLIFFFEDVARGALTTSAIEVVAQLVRLLINSNTPVSEEDLVEDYAPRDQDVLALQDAIVKSIGVFMSRVNASVEQVSGMVQIADKLTIHSSNSHLSALLLNCLLAVAVHIRESSPQSGTNRIIDALIPFINNKDTNTRLTVQRIFHNLLLPGSGSRASVTLPSTTQTARSLSFDLVDDKKNEKRSEQLRRALYSSLLIETNLPENFAAISKTFCTLFALYKVKDLEMTVPLMFALEDVVTKEPKLPPHLCHAVHSVVATYLLHVAQSFAASQLQDYLLQVMNDEWIPALTFRDGELLVTKNNKFKKKVIKRSQPIKIPIDREQVVSHLCKVNLLVQYKDLKEALMTRFDNVNEFNTNNNKEENNKQLATSSSSSTVYPAIASSAINLFPAHSQTQRPPSVTITVDDFRKIIYPDSEKKERVQSPLEKRRSTQSPTPSQVHAAISPAQSQDPFALPVGLKFKQLVTVLAKQNESFGQRHDRVFNQLIATAVEDSIPPYPVTVSEDLPQISASSTVALEFPVLTHATFI